MADVAEAVERIKTAIAGKPKKAYARVLAADVVAVAATVPEDRRNQFVIDNAAGAQRAIGERIAAVDPETIEVFQIAGQLAQLLERAGAEPV